MLECVAPTNRFAQLGAHCGDDARERVAERGMQVSNVAIGFTTPFRCRAIEQSIQCLPLPSKENTGALVERLRLCLKLVPCYGISALNHIDEWASTAEQLDLPSLDLSQHHDSAVSRLQGKVNPNIANALSSHVEGLFCALQDLARNQIKILENYQHASRFFLCSTRIHSLLVGDLCKCSIEVIVILWLLGLGHPLQSDEQLQDDLADLQRHAPIYTGLSPMSA